MTSARSAPRRGRHAAAGAARAAPSGRRRVRGRTRAGAAGRAAPAGAIRPPGCGRPPSPAAGRSPSQSPHHPARPNRPGPLRVPECVAAAHPAGLPPRPPGTGARRRHRERQHVGHAVDCRYRRFSACTRASATSATVTVPRARLGATPASQRARPVSARDGPLVPTTVIRRSPCARGGVPETSAAQDRRLPPRRRSRTPRTP